MEILIDKLRMGTISLRRLSDKTIEKYKRLEAEGNLSERQRKLWDNHNIMVGVNGQRPFMDLFIEAQRRKRDEE